MDIIKKIDGVLNEKKVSSKIANDIKKTANKERKKGAEVELNSRMNYISVKRSDGADYYFQGEGADEIFDQIPDNVNDEDFVLWYAQGF